MPSGHSAASWAALQQPQQHAPQCAARAGDTPATRYAIYFAPHPASAWWTFGSAWLARDAVSGAALARPAIAQWTPAQLSRITAEPRRYGFHATLKAPFRLAQGFTAHDVYQQAAQLAGSLTPAPLPPLKLTELDGFVALSFLPSTAGAAAIHAIARQCVIRFDHLRAAATAVELERRQLARLSERQARHLVQWGYPHVFDEYRFHLTLTARLPDAERAQIIEALLPRVSALNTQPLLMDALTVFRQGEPDAPLMATRRYHFDGRVDVYRDE